MIFINQQQQQQKKKIKKYAGGKKEGTKERKNEKKQRKIFNVGMVVQEMTANKSCSYGEYASFDYFIFVCF